MIIRAEQGLRRATATCTADAVGNGLQYTLDGFNQDNVNTACSSCKNSTRCGISRMHRRRQAAKTSSAVTERERERKGDIM